MSSRGMPKTKSIRDGLRKAAQERQAESDKLTIKQKLDRLPPTGANRQRARYLAALEAAASKPKEVVVVEDSASEKEKKALKEEKKRMKKENKQ